MPEFTNTDKLCVMQERAMWIVANILREELAAVDHAWKSRIRQIADEATKIAQELRDYNDHFEREE